MSGTTTQNFPEFNATKVKVLNSLILYMAIGSLPLLSTSLLIFYSSGWKVSMVIDTIGLLSIPVIYFFRNKIAYRIKFWYFIIMGYAAAMLVLHDYSFFGTGFIILSSITLISTLFFGMRTGWLLMLLNLLLIACVGILYQYNILTYNFNFSKYIHSTYTWIDHVATFLFFIGIVIIAAGQIHSALIKINRQATAEKEKFEGLFHNIQDAILIFTPNGRILEMNNSLLEMFGIDRGSVLVTRAEDFPVFGDSGIPEISTGEGFRKQYEWKAKRFDNQQPFYVEVMLSAIEFGDQKAILANIRNITQRRQAEEALRQSEEKYRSLIECSPAGIFIVQNNRFMYVNPSGARSLGYTSFDELAGKNIFGFVAPEYKKIAEYRLEMSGKRTINTPVELRLYKADGSELWAETISLPFDFYGEPAILIMGFDITERKKADEIIYSKNKEIENRNKELALLNQKLKFAKEKAEESDRLKSAFLSNMSHEIRTPMNAILGFSDLLIKASLTAKKKKEYIEIINSSGNQLLSLINDIIDISKIESNQIVIDYSSQLDLKEVFKQLSLMFSEKAKSLNLHFGYEINLKPSQCLVYLDEIRLKQILVNLIGNALKFTGSGFVLFKVSMEKNELLFSVEDSGIGIEPQLQMVIFDRFRQADGSTTRDYGGTGLGLAISKALVELMGGKIWLSSTPGKGTTFFFTLPFRPDETVPSEVFQEFNDIKVEVDWSHKKILLVDDEEVNILFLTELLKPTGVSVVPARNAAEAWKGLDKVKKVDLVLMDIRIPGVDGYQITREIKQKFPEIPVIAQTAYALAEERKLILKSGFDDYVSKPINKTVLFGIISRFLDS